MVTQRRYVRKYVVGGSGISDFFKSIVRKGKEIFSKISPHANKVLNSDIGKALTSSGKDLAIAGIKTASTYGLSKLKQKELEAKAAQENAIRKSNSEVSEFGATSIAPKPLYRSEPSDSLGNRYAVSQVQSAMSPQYVQSGGSLTDAQKFYLKLAIGNKLAKMKQAREQQPIPSGSGIKIQKYAKMVAGRGLNNMY